jgi:hypothetical protein
MISSINSMRLPSSLPMLFPSASPLRQTTSKVFERMKDSGRPQVNNLQSINFQPLLSSGNFIEAGVWAGFWGLSILFSAMSLRNLHKVLTIEHPASEKFSKISEAVKEVFVKLVSLGGATAHNIHWWHEIKVLSLGKYAPLVKGLGFGASLVISLVEGGWSINAIYVGKKALLQAISPIEREKHKQQIYISLVKVIGNINMIAWTVLGIAAITSGIAVSSILMTPLLIVGCACPIGAYFYQKHIEKALNIRLTPA